MVESMAFGKGAQTVSGWVWKWDVYMAVERDLRGAAYWGA
jgi:hypothetical protein